MTPIPPDYQELAAVRPPSEPGQAVTTRGNTTWTGPVTYQPGPFHRWQIVPLDGGEVMVRRLEAGEKAKASEYP